MSLFSLLAILFTGIAVVNIQTWLAYKETFAARTASADWFQHKLPNYSADVSDQVIAVWRLQTACEQFAAHAIGRGQFSLRRQQVAGTLEAYEPSVLLGKELARHESYDEAYQAFEAFLQAALGLERGSTPMAEVRQRGAEASTLWSRLNKEVEADEYRLRDHMGYAVVEFRPLAARSFALAAALSTLFVIVVGIMGYATWHAVTHDGRRERRFELLLAAVGHDMRSPLQALIGAAKLLAAPDTPPRDRERFAQIANERGIFFTRLLDDLIDLASLSALTFAAQPLDLHRWLASAANRLQADAEAKGLAFEARIDAPNRRILFDEHRLTQCADNLVSNAIRYTDCGGVILSVRCEFAPASSDGVLTIEVQDTGRGVATENWERIFEPFVRLNDSVRGMGVGLSIVRRWSRQVGGDVHVAQSAAGKGSVFRFVAPVVEAQATMTAADEPPPLTLGERALRSDDVVHRVLVIDDDATLLEVVRGLLPHMGFIADGSQGGRAGLEKMKANDYCAVLTDIQMPDVDGLEVARTLRATQAPCPTIIAMTAYTSRGSEDEPHTLFDCVLRKPIDESELLDALDKAATRWGQQAS